MNCDVDILTVAHPELQHRRLVESGRRLAAGGVAVDHPAAGAEARGPAARSVARADAEVPRWYLLPAGHLVALLC